MSFDLVQRLPSFIVQIERLFGISPFLALKVLISTLSHVIVLRKELWCIQSAYCTALFTQTSTPIRNYEQERIKYLAFTHCIIIRQSTLSYVGSVARWDKRLINQVSWCSKYCFFFNFLLNSLQKSFHLFSYNFLKVKVKSFECLKSIRNYEKKYTWNVNSLVDKSFVQATQHCRILGSRSNFCLKIIKFIIKIKKGFMGWTMWIGC